MDHGHCDVDPLFVVLILTPVDKADPKAGLGGLVVSGGDTPPVFEPVEHTLDTLSQLVGMTIVAGGVSASHVWPGSPDRHPRR